MQQTISIEEYNRRVEYNTKECRRQLANKSCDLMKYYGFDFVPEEKHSFELINKGTDILSAVHIGALSIMGSLIGGDAIKLENGVFTPIELKTSYQSTKHFFKTPNGTIYCTSPKLLLAGTPHKNGCRCAKSCFNATYSSIVNEATLISKAIDTYFIAYDADCDGIIIDSVKIPSYKIFTWLSNSKVLTKQVTLKLTDALTIGECYRDTAIEVIGIDKWLVNILPELPILKLVNHLQKIAPKKNVSVIVSTSDSL